MLKRLRSLFRVLARRRDFEDGMSEELRFHIEQYTDDLVRSGMSPEKAARLATDGTRKPHQSSKRIAAKHLAFTCLTNFAGS